MEPAAVIGVVLPRGRRRGDGPARDPCARRAAPSTCSTGSSSSTRSGDKAGEDRAFRFRNQLIRDATYASLLKRTRAQLHEQFVTWAERVNRERGREEEFEEINGYHLEQAYRYRLELGAARRARTRAGVEGCREAGQRRSPRVRAQ